MNNEVAHIDHNDRCASFFVIKLKFSYKLVNLIIN